MLSFAGDATTLDFRTCITTLCATIACATTFVSAVKTDAIALSKHTQCHNIEEAFRASESSPYLQLWYRIADDRLYASLIYKNRKMNFADHMEKVGSDMDSFYVAFGVPPVGAKRGNNGALMIGADVVVLSGVGKATKARDYFVNKTAQECDASGIGVCPDADKSQNWKNEADGSLDMNSFQYHFSRPLKASGAGDVAIHANDVHTFIWAFGPLVKGSDTVRGHGLDYQKNANTTTEYTNGLFMLTLNSPATELADSKGKCSAGDAAFCYHGLRDLDTTTPECLCQLGDDTKTLPCKACLNRVSIPKDVVKNCEGTKGAVCVNQTGFDNPTMADQYCDLCVGLQLTNNEAGRVVYQECTKTTSTREPFKLPTDAPPPSTQKVPDEFVTGGPGENGEGFDPGASTKGAASALLMANARLLLLLFVVATRLGRHSFSILP